VKVQLSVCTQGKYSCQCAHGGSTAGSVYTGEVQLAVCTLGKYSCQCAHGGSTAAGVHTGEVQLAVCTRGNTAALILNLTLQWPAACVNWFTPREETQVLTEYAGWTLKLEWGHYGEEIELLPMPRIESWPIQHVA